MITAQAMEQKWLDNATAAADTWAANLNATTKDIVGNATSAATQAKATANYTSAWTSGRLQAALQKVGNAGIKQAAQNKKANYPVGITDAAPRFLAFAQKLLPYIAAGLPAIDAMPNGNRTQAKAKQNAWLDYMADGKGQFT